MLFFKVSKLFGLYANIEYQHRSLNRVDLKCSFWACNYLVPEWKSLLFTKVKLFGVVVHKFRLRKASSLRKNKIENERIFLLVNFNHLAFYVRHYQQYNTPIPLHMPWLIHQRWHTSLLRCWIPACWLFHCQEPEQRP